MKKISFLFLALLFNFAMVSCTDESLDEIFQVVEKPSATTEGNEENQPKEEPPEGED